MATSTRISTLMETADQLLATAEYEQAIETYRTILKKSPKKVDALHGLGQALVEIGQYDEGIECLQNAVKLKEDNARLFDSLGHAYTRKGEYDAAIESYQKAVSHDPGLMVTYYDWIEAIVTAGAKAKDIEVFHSVLENNLPLADIYSLLNALGQRLVTEGKQETALEQFRIAVHLDPEAEAAYDNWRNVLNDEAAPESFIDEYHEVLSRVNNPHVLHNWAVQIHNSGKPEAAAPYYERIIAIQADYPYAHYNLGLAYLASGNYKAAEQHFRKSSEQNPQDANSLYQLGLALSSQKQYSAAVESFRQAVALDPSNAIIYRGWGVTAVEARNDEWMQEILNEIEKNLSDADLLVDFGVELDKLGDYDKAIETYKKALEIKPDSSLALNNWGVALNKSGKLSEGIAKQLRAIELDPDFALAYKNVVDGIKHLENPDHVIEALKKLVDKHPNAETYQEMATAYRNASRMNEAIDYLQKALELAPENEAVLRDLAGVAALADDEALDAVTPFLEAKIVNPDLFIDFGFALDAQSKYQRAIAQYRNALERKSDSHLAYNNWGAALAKLGDYETAVAKQLKSIELDPSFELAYTNVVHNMEHLEDPTAALKQMADLVNQHPTAHGHRKVGDGFAQLKDFEAAIAAYRQSIEIAAGDDAWRGLGTAAAASGNEKILAETTRFIEASVENPDIFINFGVELDGNKRYAEAIRQYQNALKHDPDSALAYNNWGVALRKQGDTRGAIDKQLQAIKVDGNYQRAYRNIAANLPRLENSDEALGEFRKAVEKNPGAASYTDLATGLYNLKQYREAIAACQKALEEDKNHGEAYARWASCHSALEEYNEALKKYQLAIQYDPDSEWNYFEFGLTLDNMGRSEDAIAQYRKMLEVKSDSVFALEWWGVALGNLQRHDAAVEKYREALAIDPKHSSIHFRWGNTLLEMLRYDEAVRQFRLGQDADGDYSIRCYSAHNIAFIAEKTGRYREARELWGNVIKIYEETLPQARERRDAYHYLYLGSIYHQARKEYEKAESIYLQGLAYEPENALLHMNLLELYLEEKEAYYDNRSEENGSKKNESHWKALREYRILKAYFDARLADHKSRQMLWQRGKIELQMKQYDAAEADFQAVLKEDPSMISALIDIGVSKMQQDQFSEAAGYFEQAMSIDPDNLTTRKNLAEACLKGRDKQQAEKIYREMLDLAPFHADALVGLGEVYTAMGEDANKRDARGDAEEMFSRANDYFGQALALESDKAADASRKLSPADVSAIHYSRGFARVKLFEAQGRKENRLMQNALSDFKRVLPGTDNFFKAGRAAHKLEARMNPPQEVATTWGPRIIALFAMLVFLGAQWGYFYGLPQYEKSEVRFNPQQLLAPLSTADADSLSPRLSELAGEAFASRQAAMEAVEQLLGSSMASRVNVGQSIRGSGKLELIGRKPMDATPYGLLTFGALIFMVAGLYLQEISRLKFGAIELEKSSSTRVSSSSSLGISK